MIIKDKRILGTGSDGFIGSHLTEMLVKEGCSVKALSQYNSFNNWGWLEDIDCLDNIEVLGLSIDEVKHKYADTKTGMLSELAASRKTLSLLSFEIERLSLATVVA